MNYDETTIWMDSLSKKGIHPGLTDIKALCDAFQNPEKDLRFIHIAGTNGKGSVSQYISSILRESGLKVGKYSSPKVYSELEIIQCNGRNISKKDYSDILSEIKEKEGLSYTRFEAETMLALLYFKRKAVDVVVWECGMGGLLDATNVVENTEAAVFTSINLDHMEYLGNTVEEITRNKAGIIKKDSLVVSGKNDEAVINTLKEFTNELSVVNDNEIKNVKLFKEYTKFDYKNLKGLKLSMLGLHQVQNACLSIEVCDALLKIGYKIPEKAIYNGLLKGKVFGRFDKISDKPLFFLDGAHNEPAAIMLEENIKAYFTKKQIVYIMGMFKDKDVEKVLLHTAKYASHIICVTLPDKKRSLSGFTLATTVKDYNSMVSTSDSIEEAVELSLLMTEGNKDAVVLAFGSLSHLRLVKDILDNRKSIKKDFHGLKEL